MNHGTLFYNKRWGLLKKKRWQLFLFPTLQIKRKRHLPLYRQEHVYGNDQDQALSIMVILHVVVLLGWLHLLVVLEQDSCVGAAGLRLHAVVAQPLLSCNGIHSITHGVMHDPVTNIVGYSHFSLKENFIHPLAGLVEPLPSWPLGWWSACLGTRSSLASCHGNLSY